jgi:hypothetical protein
MSRHVAKISVCFQGFPIFAGGSTRHGRNMVFFPTALEQIEYLEFDRSLSMMLWDSLRC